jgi:hypothetical protein
MLITFMSEIWTRQEVEFIVADYFSMLTAELNNIPINKTEHRRSLLPKLNNRSEGSIERKHQNISAILREFNHPYIKGYKPLPHYQKGILTETVLHFLNINKSIEKTFEDYADARVLKKQISDFASFLTDAPEPISIVAEKEVIYRTRKTNYLEREEQNRSLGESGEEIAIQYEKWRLVSKGKESLADKIEWISKEQGDGAGYDILSKNENGSDRYIEVKTTKLGKETPIFFSKTELDFSMENSKSYHLYRVFDYAAIPRMFIKNGALNQFCTIEATHFKGFF